MNRLMKRLQYWTLLDSVFTIPAQYIMKFAQNLLSYMQVWFMVTNSLHP